MAVTFQRKAEKKKKRYSNELPSFSKMTSGAGMDLFPGQSPFPYNVLHNESGFS